MALSAIPVFQPGVMNPVVGSSFMMPDSAAGLRCGPSGWENGAAGLADTQQAAQLLGVLTLVLSGLVANGAKADKAKGGPAPVGDSHGAAGADGSASTAVSATGKLETRQGEKIDSSIAQNFDAMVAAAKKDGVNLEIESAWRSREEQEALYQKYLNGTGNLAAKPGTSNHESGQAIDFKDTPGAFDWLKKNAEQFGLKNLPSEPWHYSVDGR